ncbi:CTRB1 protein, partial [Phaetusa simplex]|nr:CTRB1 protein [Phaetusa simplex]
SNTGGSGATTCSLGSGEEESTAARCLTAGWGETGAGKEEEPAAGFQQAEISLLSHQACANYWGKNIEGTNIGDSSLLSPSLSSLFSLFQGDSGWPLLCVIDGHYNLAGVASWSSDKCHPESPTVYTGLSDCGHWISSVTN